MRIQEIFKKEITRPIKGVIKVEQRQAESVKQELEEYVVTKELQRHFNTFYDAYNKSLTGEIDEMGVWISGFFGSGKSHFLKILSYLLANKEVLSKKALDFFEDKISDPMLLGEMRRAAQPDTDVILFNIDSKSDMDSKVKKDAILKVFLRVFNDFQGFCGAIPWIAEMERQLVRRGTYQTFQGAFAEKAGDTWAKLRGNGYFERDSIIAALTKGAGMTGESAAQWFDRAESNYVVTIDDFVKTVQDYCQTAKKRIVFMVDEMGQYIGDNSDLMLNLQTLTEDLGTHLRGKAWVIVTSQEDIDGVTKGKAKGRDFSKIIGRFATRISLSSSNTDEVIKRRVLEKEDWARNSLSSVYAEKNAVLRNLISFSTGTAEMKAYQDERDFIESYPFVTYQFNLVQKVFEAIRKFGMTGKHLSEGERSMLSAFQGAAIEYKDQGLEVLVPFDSFYQTVEMFIDTSIQRGFLKAGENGRLVKEFDPRVLRVLFMIKHVKEIPANLENLTTLLLENIDEDKIELRRKIAASLNRLQGETLIQQNGDEYYFLTDDEQEINREIKQVPVDERDMVEYGGKLIFDEIYGAPRYAYTKLYTYSFNRQVDSVSLSQPVNELTVQILTPYANEYTENIEILKMQSLDSGTLMIRLPEENGSLSEIGEFLRLDKYLKQRATVKSAENIQRILEDKGRELNQRRSRVSLLLKQAVEEAEFYGCGEKLTVKPGAPKDRMNHGLQILVENFYRKLEYVKKPVMEPQEIAGILRSDPLQIPLLKEGDNRQAVQEVLGFIRMRDEQNVRVTMKSLHERFTIKPYGWRTLDLAGLAATLWMAGEVRLQYNGENLEPEDKSVVNYLTKPTEAERLVVLLRKKTDLETLNIIRVIGRDVFERPYLPNEEDEIFEELKGAVQEEIQKLQGFIGRYQTQNYPGREIVEKGLKLLKEIVTYKDSTSFFQELKGKKDILLTFVDEITPIKGFFSNQVEKYDQGRKRLDYYQHNLVYIPLGETLDSVGKLQGIMESPVPYSFIKDIPYLVNNLDQVYTEQLKSRKDNVSQYLAAARQKMEGEMAQAKFPDEKAESIRRQFDQLAVKLQGALDFAQVDSLKVQTDNLVQESQDRIDAFREPVISDPSPPVGGEEPPVSPPLKPKKTTRVKVAEVAGEKTLLETEADVEAYLNELRRKLMEIIQADQKVRLQ